MCTYTYILCDVCTYSICILLHRFTYLFLTCILLFKKLKFFFMNIFVDYFIKSGC